jgi:hypothetical protein
MSSGAPNLACEVSLSPIACPRNPGMPEGSLRLVKRRADLAARDPNAGFASAMSELEECASREERDDAVVDATSSSGVANGADVASPATASPASPASAARAEAPPVALGARPSQTDPEAARFVAAVMAYAAVTAEETSGSRVGERGAGDVFREMRAGVEEHIMSVVGSQKRTSADAPDAATPLEKPEPVESVESVASVESAVEASLFADSAANGVESGAEPARDLTQDSQDAAPSPLAAEPEASAPEARFANRAPPRRRGASGATAAAALIAAVAVAAAAAFARRLRRAKLPGAPEGSEEAKATTNASSEGKERVNRFAKALRAKSRVALRVGAGLFVARDAAARRAAAMAGRVAVAARRATAATAARLPFRAAAAAESSSSAAVGDARVSEARAEEAVEEAVSTAADPTSFPASPVPEPENAVAQTAISAISPDPGSDSDPDEAIFEEASKIGRDLIRGLLPTPLMLHGKTKPRWAEGDMSPAMAPAPETATTLEPESAHSPGTPPSELERLDSRDAPVSKYAAEIRGDDVASPNDSSDELSSANDASDSDSDAQYSDSQYSESDSEYDSENSESHVSGIGPGVRAAAPARAAPAFFPPQTLNFAANGFGPFPPGVAVKGGQRVESPGFANPPGGSPEAAAAAQYQQYQQFVQYQQFMQFQQMQQMQQMQSSYATPGANVFGNTFGAASPASPSSREMSKMAVAHRRRALARMAFARLRLQARAARRARSAERRERRRSAGRRQSFGNLESSSPGSRTKKPFVRTQVFEIEQRAAAAALERERETATAMPAMSTPSVGIAA